MSRYKILIVDDSPFMCKVFSDFVSADPAFEVAGTASDGMEAIERTLALSPDIITMDMEMPQMNGLEALKRLMTVRPTPVIMISAVTDNGTRDTIRALQYGAVDFIRKPDQSLKLDIRYVGEQLLEKLHIAAEMVGSGNFRVLPAIEEQLESDDGEVPAEEGGSAQAYEEQQAADISASTIEIHTHSQSDSTASSGTGGGAGQPATEERQRKKETPASESASAPSVPLPPAAPASKRSSISQPEVNRMPSPEQAKAPPTPDAAVAPLKARLYGKAAATPPTAQAPAVKDRQPRETAAKTTRTAKSASIAPATSAAPVPAAPAVTAVPSSPDGSKKKAAGSSVFGHVVAIGTSTGGPRALHEVLTKLPADFPAPIFVVQHMPPKFTKSLAQRLDSFSEIRVCEAQDGESVQAGTAYIAPGGKHMTLVKNAQASYRIMLTDEEPRSGHKPSVDRLFESLLGMPNVKRHIVLMTGMGSDGAKGMKALRDDGAETTIAEAEQTCIVYGMPRSAVEIGAASQVLELQRIAPALVQEVIALKS